MMWPTSVVNNEQGKKCHKKNCNKDFLLLEFNTKNLLKAFVLGNGFSNGSHIICHSVTLLVTSLIIHGQLKGLIAIVWSSALVVRSH